MKKWIFAFFLVISAVVNCVFVPGVVMAQESVIQDGEIGLGLTYSKEWSGGNTSEEGHIVIEGYTGNDPDVVIPDKIEGWTVLRIENSAFLNCETIESIVLPDSITTIGESAFAGCTSLQKVDISESVKEISESAFRDCKGLKEISLPDGIQYIGRSAFSGAGLSQIDIPEGVEKIDCGAFANTQISEVIFKRPDVLIADCAFRCYGEEGYTTNIKVIGIKDSSAEVFARHVSAVFESIDGKYKKDYGIQNYCYDTAVANYEATIEFLDEYYIQKYPNLALEPLYGGEKEHKMFREIAENIVAKDIKHTEPETLYNWMNENILLNGQYGYPLDVYNFKSADCYGNATLLCELLRSIDIPAVVVTGYTGNTVSVLTEKMLEDEEVTKHAWVLTYYEGTWQLLDSAMDRMINDKQEICKWYYTNDIDDGLAIYSDLFNPNVNDGSPCFKDGEFFIYSEGCLLGRNTGYSEVIDPEWVFRVWEDFNLSGSGARYVDDNSEIKMEFNKGGWINNGGGVRYFKNNMSVLCHYVMDIDGVTYAIGQNGEMFDISSLNGNYRIKYGYPIIDVGTTFQPQPAIIGEIETIEWSSSNSNVITIDENGVFTAVGTGCAYVDCDVVTTEGSRRHFMLEIGVDNFITELSIPKNMTMKVGEKNKLKPTTNNTSMMFGHFSWESSNEEVATVDINGNVTAHKKGTAIITVTYDDGTGLKSSCVVSVKESNIVSFNGNGGTVGTTKRTVSNGTAIGTLPTPKRTGYTFTGWYTAKTGGSKVYSTTIVTKNMTLYAQWKIKIYTINFNGNGGTVGVAKKWVDHGNVMKFMPTPKRTGYKFTGWYTSASGGNKVYSTTKVTRNVILYAHWVKVHTVTFNANGGTVGVEKKWVTNGDKMNFMPTPKKTGYKFTGWYTSASGGSKVYSNTKVSKNMTLYAHWVKVHTVTFNANGGTVGVAKKWVVNGQKMNFMPTPKRTGYTFTGWYTAKSGGTKVYTTRVVKSNMTVYAHWTKK